MFTRVNIFTTRKYIYHDYTYHDGFRHRKNPFYHSYFIMKCGINIILQLLLWYFYYGNGKSNRGTVIAVERVFSLAKTIVVDVFVIYIPRIPLCYGHTHTLFRISEYYKNFKGCSSNFFLNLVFKNG